MGTGIGRWDRRVHDELSRGTNPNQLWGQRSAQAEPLVDLTDWYTTKFCYFLVHRKVLTRAAHEVSKVGTTRLFTWLP